MPLYYRENNPESIQGRRIKEGLESRGHLIEVIDESSIREYLTKNKYFLLRVLHLFLTILNRLIPPPAKDLFLLKEPYSVFNESYFRIIEMKIISNPESLLLTSSTPFCVHEIGIKIKQKYGNKWIMRLSDPYLDNPYSKATLKWTRLRQLTKEARYFHLADGISITSDNYYDLLIHRYSDLKGKFYLIYHSISLNIKTIESQRPENKNHSVKGAYLGNIYGRRNPYWFLLSVKRNVKRLEKIGFEIHFFGKVLVKYKALVKLLCLSKMVFFHGKFNQTELDSIMNDHDFFVNIESNDVPNLFFPSKLTDYFRFQKPILNLAPLGSLSRTLINNQFYSANPDNVEEIGLGLTYVIESVNKEISYNTVDMTLEKVIDRYINLIEGV